MGRGSSKVGGAGSGGIVQPSGGGGSFVSFPSKVKDGYSFTQLGEKEVVAFMDKNTNYNQLISGLNRDERNAFGYYTHGGFMSGQQYDGFSSMDSYDQDKTRVFDKILDKSYTAEGMILTRKSDAQLVLGKGHKKGTLAEMQAMEGRTVSSKGNMSFAAASQGLEIGYGSKKKVEYKLKIAGGTTGAGMWVGDGRINGWGAAQREFMINRDTFFKVGKSTYDSKRDVIVTELTYAGLGNHDYS